MTRVAIVRTLTALSLLALITVQPVFAQEATSGPGDVIESTVAPDPSGERVSSTAPDVEPLEAPAADVAPEVESVGIQEAIDEWFGTYLVEPLWTYFLGAPMFQTRVQVVLHTDQASHPIKLLLADAGLSSWTTADKAIKGSAFISVKVDEVEAAATVLEKHGFSTLPDGKLGKEGGFPFIVLVLMCGGVVFTLMFRFINIRMFRHSIDVIRGKFDRPSDEGQISHFQALTSALSATVGLGNIAGVAVAIGMGGAGAVFWMWIIAFFGMSLKFVSCSFAQLYRRVDADGHVLGGPMVYLEEGIKERYPSVAWLGKVFGVSFAVFTIMAAFGGGNMFQANQTYSLVADQFGWTAAFEAGEISEGARFATALCVGITLAFFAGIVIIGGIKRIGVVTSKVVPLMCGFYCLVCLVIIGTNIGKVPTMLSEIFSCALNGQAMFGGFVGVLIMGAKRAAFSNEAGLGSAAIAHSAAKTDEPIREGTVAMIGPFIDTIVVCTMTALAILITGAHLDPETGAAFADPQGIKITATAFSTLGQWVPWLLTIAVVIFAYSTLISWSYYGERSVEYLFGKAGIMPYRVVYVFIVIAGPVLSLKNVIGFADMMLFSMAFPNIIGLLLISGKLRPLVKDYVDRVKSGEIKPVK